MEGRGVRARLFLADEEAEEEDEEGTAGEAVLGSDRRPPLRPCVSGVVIDSFDSPPTGAPPPFPASSSPKIRRRASAYSFSLSV